MRLAALHARAMTLELARYPAYVVPTILLPSVFFLFFAVPGANADPAARMACFAGFAAIGVAFFQFGVGIAVERGSPWEAYLRTLPIGPAVRLLARLLSAALFATAAAATLVLVAILVTGATLSPRGWLAVALCLLLGTVPFGLLGIALGYWAPQRGALPIANLLYLGLAYGGALWMRPRDLPRPVAAISPYLPTRAFSDLLVAATDGPTLAWRAAAVLAGFSGVFALAAAIGYRRDEGRLFD